MAESSSTSLWSATKRIMSMSMNYIKREKLKMADHCVLACMNDDILQNILSKLPAKSFAFASCVSRTWNGLCSRILSRPKILSAISLDPDYRRAAKEALDEVLSEPIRPDFVIANITGRARTVEILNLIEERVGTRAPIIVSDVSRNLGKKACSIELTRGDTNDGESSAASNDANSAILLTVGYMPGLKVNLIFTRAEKVLTHETLEFFHEPTTTMGDKFLMNIRAYVSMVSDDTAPVAVILFGGGACDMEPIIKSLDDVMPLEALILGDERGPFACKSSFASGDALSDKSEFNVSKFVAALVFARDSQRPSDAGLVQLQTVISRGVSPVGPRYKAAFAVSIKYHDIGFVTCVTVKGEGGTKILYGQHTLDDIKDLLTMDASLCIGVIGRRDCSVGLENPKPVTSLVFRRVLGSGKRGVFIEEDEYGFYVLGTGISSGDYFQFYYSDLRAP